MRPGGRYLVIGPGHGREVPFSPTELVMKQATGIGPTAENLYRRGRAHGPPLTAAQAATGLSAPLTSS